MGNQGVKIVKSKLSVIVLTGLLLLLTGALQAEDAEQKPYYEMSLEELTSIPVVTASSFRQTVSEACAIIDVYTGDQIMHLGVDNLYEFLSFLPGVEVMETYYGYTDVQFRGILQTHYNNKSSLLVNGQPMYDAIVSSYYLEQIPLTSIKQVEVIRGPGGVLYGTNAFAGVINILTKDGESADGTKAYLKGGSFGTRKVALAVGESVDEIDLFLSGEYVDSDGYRKRIIWDEDDAYPELGLEDQAETGDRTLGSYPDDRHAYENDYVNFFTSVGYRDFKFNATFFENRKDKFGIIPTTASTGERAIRGGAVNIRYSKTLDKDRVEIRSIAWHDRIDKHERIHSYPPSAWAGGTPHDQEYGGNKTGFQTQVSRALSRRIGVLGGLGFERSHADPYVFLYVDSLSPDGQPVENEAANAFPDAKETSDLWSYGQVTANPFDKIYFQAGARFNTNEQAGTVLVPSLGAVYRPTDRLSLKCIVGEGFRNPSFFEKFVRTMNVLAGDTDLEPEKIRSIDLGVDYQTSALFLRANGFYVTTDRLIARRPLTAGEMAEINAEPGSGSGGWTGGYVYYNTEGCAYRGVEVSFNAVPRSGVSLQGNITYKSGEDSEGNELKYFAPYHANLAAHFSPLRRISLALTAQHVAEREGNYAANSGWQTWATAATGGTDYTLDAYTLLNARVAFRPAGPLELSLFVKNILDSEYVYPEYIRQSIPFIPGGPQRSMFVEVGYHL
jgi:outer membrane cobalamin receptor